MNQIMFYFSSWISITFLKEVVPLFILTNIETIILFFFKYLQIPNYNVFHWRFWFAFVSKVTMLSQVFGSFFHMLVTYLFSLIRVVIQIIYFFKSCYHLIYLCISVMNPLWLDWCTKSLLPMVPFYLSDDYFTV